MPIPEKINQSLAENLITLIAHNDIEGQIVAKLIRPELFEGDYRIIAERCIIFWEQQGEAPKGHTGDLFDDFMEKGDRRSSSLRRTLLSMMQLAETINAKYVLDQIQKFTRLQLMKDAILKSAEKINSAQDLAIEEIEGIWNELLRSQQIVFDSGLGLQDVEKILEYLERKQSEFDLGIPILTKSGIVPVRGTLLMILGAKKIGKSWSMIHVGKAAMLKKHKVLHITLEMAAEQVIQRYYQSIFSIPKRSHEIDLTQFTFDEKEEVSGLRWEKFKPSFALDSPVIRDELEAHMEKWGPRLANLKVKRFAPRSLSINGFIAYLDSLEIHDKFVPDLIVLDAPYLMKTDADNYRISLGRTVENVRAIAVERNVAMVATHQINRSGAMSTRSRSTDIGEDISIVQTCDMALAISRTEAEKKFNLARLYVEDSRDERDGMGILMVQNLDIGQFCLKAVPLQTDYFDMLRAQEAGETDDEDGDDE